MDEDHWQEGNVNREEWEAHLKKGVLHVLTDMCVQAQRGSADPDWITMERWWPTACGSSLGSPTYKQCIVLGLDQVHVRS